MKSRIISLIWAGSILLAGVFCVALAAEPPAAKEPQHEAESYVRAIPGRSLKAQPGKVAIIESGADYSYSFKAWERLPVTLSVATQHYNLDESASVSLPTQLTGVEFQLETTLPFFKCPNTYWRNRLMPSWYTDNWRSNNSAFRLPVHSFLIYQPNEKFTWVGGVAVYSGFLDPVFPIIGVIYKPSPKLTLNLIPDDPDVTYQLNERLALFCAGGISKREFEVTKDGLKGVRLSYAQAYAGAGARVKINSAISASISSGYMFKHYLQFGDSLGKVNIKNGQYCEFKIEARI